MLAAACAVLTLVVTGSLAGVGAASAGAAPAPDLPQGTIFTGFGTELSDPGGFPPGMNVPCTPTGAHPFPVVLVAGTGANENVSWQALSPALADEGYCVYGFNYGATSISGGRFYGLGDIPTSAHTLAAFVSGVLSTTHATKVDIVGHSQGGMMPRYYMKFLGGAAKVNMLVGLAPSNHGTTLDGLTALTSLFGPNLTTGGACDACTQQEAGSTFLSSLNAGGDTQSGPRYVVIESEYDEVVTPVHFGLPQRPEGAEHLVADPVRHGLQRASGDPVRPDRSTRRAQRPRSGRPLLRPGVLVRASGHRVGHRRPAPRRGDEDVSVSPWGPSGSKRPAA